MNCNPYKFYLLIAFILCVSIGIFLCYFTAFHSLWIYLIALNLITFLFFGYDKYQSIQRDIRVPESVLHLLALLGGTIGAFFGQLFFRHKTRKLKFKVVFYTIVFMQIGMIMWWKLRQNR